MGESKAAWYWRRLRAMTPAEMLGRARVMLRQRVDRKGPPDFSGLLIEAKEFPILPDLSGLDRAALEKEAKEIVAGRWKFFGHLTLEVDTPPKWQFDYLVERDFQSRESAFDLEHRAQPDGADIKVIWEPNRWQHLAQLALAAHVLNDAGMARTCVDWLKDWEKNNPAYTGLNWTSALETGIRLIQFTWIDALLEKFEKARLMELRRRLLPNHYWYTARYLSFGSSANNHLLGEVAGLAAAQARFPALASLRPEIEELHRIFEREVLLQFAADGGNREQALSYHAFSLELALTAREAIASAGHPISTQVEERLQKAEEFYAAQEKAWDYGDSDNAIVLPFEARAKRNIPVVKAWRLFAESGYAMYRDADWRARLDASELGYLGTAAHGHLDALHFSLWRGAEPVVIDPGTGAYYADKRLRDHLSSWAAHNGPHLSGKTEFPRRYGTFLWGAPHPRPLLSLNGSWVMAEIETHGCMLRRHVRLEAGEWEVLDEVKLLTGEADPASLGDVRVHWHFAPGSQLEKISESEFRLKLGKGSVRIRLRNWKVAKWANPAASENGLEMVCSPAFRAVAAGPILHLQQAVDSLESCSTRFAAE